MGDLPAPAAELQDVCVQYGQTRVLEGVRLSIRATRITAVVGESGSGKSTLLKLLNGLVAPASGTIRVLGEPIDYDGLPDLRRRIGYAVQDVGLFPHLTVAENVLLPVRVSGESPEEASWRLGHLMDLMGLQADLARRYPHELSGGQQQRVGICRAMVRQPPLLLLDESFSGVDALTRTEIHDRFLALQRTEGTAVVLVTHDVREAAALGHRVAVMRDGRLVAEGSLEELRHRPDDDYARRLLAPVLA